MSNLRPLSPDLQKIAIEALNEKPDRVAEDIAILKLWIQQQPHLRARTDDQFLLAFLRGCKFSLEKAKSKIDKFYTLRTKYPELFTSPNLEEPRIRELIRLGIGLCLPIPLRENGPRIIIARSGLYPADKFNISDVMRLVCLSKEIMLLEDDCAVVNGCVHIMDLSQMTAQHFAQFTPSFMKRMAVYMEQALPLRMKDNHFINTLPGFEPFFKLLKPLLSAKLQSRLFVHGSKIEKLYEYIPQKYLPKEYGGENGTITEIIDYWEEKILSYRDHFKDEENYGTDEKLRIGEPIDFNSMFGLDGTFRQLNID